MKNAKRVKPNEVHKNVRGKAKRKASTLNAEDSEIVRIAIANSPKQVGQQPVAVVRVAEKTAKQSRRHVGRQVGEITEAESARMAKLLEAGKLRVRRAPDGKVIPDDQDFLDVEREHPKKSPAERHQLAQACALLRALRHYDEDQTRAP
ncbi:MAG: hypothetical protein M5U26_10350 [Planctomycetota bacterium]|nr:hypothetical protein [Planctomycetota bacterium]